MAGRLKPIRFKPITVAAVASMTKGHSDHAGAIK